MWGARRGNQWPSTHLDHKRVSACGSSLAIKWLSKAISGHQRTLTTTGLRRWFVTGHQVALKGNQWPSTHLDHKRVSACGSSIAIRIMGRDDKLRGLVDQRPLQAAPVALALARERMRRRQRQCEVL